MRRNGSIVLLDREGNEKARWNFFNAWPTKYDGPDFNAEGNDVAIETLELAHEGVETSRIAAKRGRIPRRTPPKRREA